MPVPVAVSVVFVSVKFTSLLSIKISTPDPPVRLSVPPLPVNLSCPEPPSNTSFALLPINTSSPAPPRNVTLPVNPDVSIILSLTPAVKSAASIPVSVLLNAPPELSEPPTMDTDTEPPVRFVLSAVMFGWFTPPALPRKVMVQSPPVVSCSTWTSSYPIFDKFVSADLTVYSGASNGIAVVVCESNVNVNVPAVGVPEKLNVTISLVPSRISSVAEVELPTNS